MWWKVTLAVLVLMVVFFVGGLYAGAAVYLQLSTGSTAGMAMMTLIDTTRESQLNGVNAYLPWGWAVTAALTFLPVGVTLMALLSRFKPEDNLHGKARFANDRELEQFAYRGEYQ